VLRVAFVVLSNLALAGAAHAGACPPARLVVLPGDDLRGDDTAAPTNVELRVVFDARRVEVVEMRDRTTRSTVASGTASAADATLVLRGADGVEVPIDVRRALGAAHPVWLARPRSELVPNARYTVSIRTKERDYAVAHFTTTSGPLRDAPQLTRVASARVLRWPEPRSWKDPSGLYAELALDGLAGAAGLELHELAADELPSATTLRWIGSAAATVRLGSTTACPPASFAFPDPPKGKLHLWLRAYDLAGKTTELREVVLDPAHPQRAR
jgi:hypothetical protein